MGGRDAAVDVGSHHPGLARPSAGREATPAWYTVEPGPNWSPTTAWPGQPMFTSPPGCYLDHEASFITAFYAQDRLGGAAGRDAHPRPRTDFDFVPFPPLTTAGQGQPPR